MPPKSTQGDRRYISPVQAARAMGMSESTVKRWVDEDRLPAHRTAGGHRRILVQDLLELIRREKLPCLDLAVLGVAELAPPMDIPELNQQLEAALRTENAELARSLIGSAHQYGLTTPELADAVISPVMERIGHGWATGELDVYQEHRATQVCLSALVSLKARIEAAAAIGPERPLAVGGGPARDHYLLANLLIEMTLRELGWRVVNIGPNTPFVSFRKALRDLRPRLVWLSCSYISEPDDFLTGYHALYEEAEQARVAVTVGGRALTEELRRRMTFTHHGDQIAHLAAYARQLNPDQASTPKAE